jgi:hypothetical protein
MTGRWARSEAAYRLTASQTGAAKELFDFAGVDFAAGGASARRTYLFV